MLCAFIVAEPCQAAQSSIRLEVQQNQKLETKGKTDETKTQARQLDFTLTNLSHTHESNLTIRYWFFGKSIDGGAEKVMKKGEVAMKLDAGETKKAQSDTVTTTYTEDHYKVEKSKGKSSGKGKSSNTKVKKVEGEGSRITGYAVQVIEEGRIAASYYSAPSYEALLTRKE